MGGTPVVRNKDEESVLVDALYTYGYFDIRVVDGCGGAGCRRRSAAHHCEASKEREVETLCVNEHNDGPSVVVFPRGRTRGCVLFRALV